MDFESLKSQVAGLSLYDIKAGFRKAQNAVMNYTEMEAKVREATNNEPWGASTTIMNEIASATFNYANLNEIMPMIYKRFTEKSAEEWRQIYKALQLLEFLIKNGSERVIDDARSHLSLLKMLKQFHYIDQNGKDQGLNVRNRAKELGELLSDVERIRGERKKSRVNRNKYGGVEGGAGASMGGSTERYGGFGSESVAGSSTFGGYSGGVYGDGGGFGGNAADDYTETQTRRDKFQEYDEYDEGGVTSPSSSARTSRPTASATSRSSAPKTAPPKTKPKPKEPEVDLFDFNDEPINTPVFSNGKATAAPASNDYGLMESGGAEDDDFDDFVSATPAVGAAPTRTSTISSVPFFASPAPVTAQPPTSFANNLYSSISPPPFNSGSAAPNYSSFSSPPPIVNNGFQPLAAATSTQSFQAPRPAGYQGAQPNYFGSIQATAADSNPTSPTAQGGRPAYTSPLGGARPAAKNGGDPFASLSLGGLGSKKGAAGSQSKGPTMADLNKERASAGIWGASAGGLGAQQRPAQGQGQSHGSAGDLLGL